MSTEYLSEASWVVSSDDDVLSAPIGRHPETGNPAKTHANRSSGTTVTAGDRWNSPPGKVW